MLELQGIRKTFYPGTPNEKKALNGVDLHLNAGDFVTIVGSNGAGSLHFLMQSVVYFPWMREQSDWIPRILQI